MVGKTDKGVTLSPPYFFAHYSVISSNKLISQDEFQDVIVDDCKNRSSG